MKTMHCGACGEDIPVMDFPKHVDGHSDAELEAWEPGGLAAAHQAIEDCLDRAEMSRLEELVRSGRAMEGLLERAPRTEPFRTFRAGNITAIMALDPREVASKLDAAGVSRREFVTILGTMVVHPPSEEFISWNAGVLGG